MALNGRLPAHVDGLLCFLSRPSEKSNEDLAVQYFRHLYPDSFRRQTDACGADGYVPGSLVLELKTRTADWLAGLCQGVAYNRDLDFSVVVVAAKDFLAVWRVEDLPERMRSAILAADGAASAVGQKFSRLYTSEKAALLRKAIWTGRHVFLELFASKPELVRAELDSFEKTLRAAKKVRRSITPRNFTGIVKEMTQYFDSRQPTKAVNAFYSMVYAWDEHAVLQISQRVPTQATLGGEIIRDLIPGKRLLFKEFVELHAIRLNASENTDEFFSRYDEALDAADKEFRIRHGIFFTDLSLSKFALWVVKQQVPDLGKNYIVIDPACGSGNLVSNWRSPLELRHKVVSEIAPDLLYVVEKRMQGDQWHDGKFTVVPRTAEERGLNFLDKSAGQYLEEITSYLKQKGYRADKPLAFLCNPPYRSDDDQSSAPISYEVHSSIVDLIGRDASAERYCCFLAQMSIMCKEAMDSGLPGESVLLVFSKAAWLTERTMFRQLRQSILHQFKDCVGFLVNSKQFFDVKGRFPIAFTVWKYVGDSSQLDPDRPIPLIDLTDVTQRDLAALPWGDANAIDQRCRDILNRAPRVALGAERESLKHWIGQSMTDFKRSRRTTERGVLIAGGLPRGDARARNKKVYGEALGNAIGFMDDLTPCRIRKPPAAVPHFHLDPRFMRVRDARCLSGHSDHYSYRPDTPEQAKRLFFWYALARTFAQLGYPMWVDASEIWSPRPAYQLDEGTVAYALAIGLADNECVETVFPANDPVAGAPELTCSNPMAPNVPSSFWSEHLETAALAARVAVVNTIIRHVKTIYDMWSAKFARVSEIHVPFSRPYFVGDGTLRRTAGLIQIRDYALESDDASLKVHFDALRASVSDAKREFHQRLLDPHDIDYFGAAPYARRMLSTSRPPRRAGFDDVLNRRLAVAATIVHELRSDKHLGRTKLAKIFYLADTAEDLKLQTNYVREAAGPLDARALYNDKIGVEALAKERGYFVATKSGRAIRYMPGAALTSVVADAPALFSDKWHGIKRIIELCRRLDTDQCEIVATLFACWNDLILEGKRVNDEMIIREFRRHWHEAKRRFSSERLLKALAWMRHYQLVPKGRSKHTRPKVVDVQATF